MLLQAEIQNSSALHDAVCCAEHSHTPRWQGFDCRFASANQFGCLDVNKKSLERKRAIWSGALDVLSSIIRITAYYDVINAKIYLFSFLATLPLPNMHFLKQFPPCSDRPRIELASTIATFLANIPTYRYMTFSFEQFFSESHAADTLSKTDRDREKLSKFKPKLIDRAKFGQR